MKKFDRQVVVTGGDWGDGGATYKRFAKDGAKVAVFDKKPGVVQKVANEVKATVGFDVPSGAIPPTIRHLMQRRRRPGARLGPIGVLVKDVARRIYRDARLLRLYEGKTQMQQIIIGRELLRAA